MSSSFFLSATPGANKSGDAAANATAGNNSNNPLTPTEEGLPASPLDVWVPKKEDSAGSPASEGGTGTGGGAGDKGQEGGVVKANKGMILRKSVEYIRWVLESLFTPSLCCSLGVEHII